MPSGSFRLSAMLRLPRLQPWRCGCSSRSRRAAVLTLMTSAPRSASTCVPHGPATASPRSSTTTPSSGDAGAAVEAAPSRPWRRRQRVGLGDAPRRCAAPSRRWCAGRRRWGTRGGRRPRPTWRIAPSSGSSTSTTQPSARSAGSSSASSGERTGWSGHADLGGELHPLARTGTWRSASAMQRLVVVQQDHLVGVGADARVVASRGRAVFSVRCTAIAFGGAEDEVGERHPVVDPAAVGAPEEALGCPRVDDPGLEVRRVGVLDPLPGAERWWPARPAAARSRPRWPRPVVLARPQGGADADGGDVDGARLGHGTPECSGPVAAGADPAAVGGARGRANAGAIPARRPMVPPGTPRLSHWWPVRAATSASMAGRSASGAVVGRRR